MIFSGIELTGRAPFSDVIINATVLTREGKRMSKSLGTGIDPLMLVDKYGADGTRFGLAWQMTESQDIHFNEDNMLAGKKFVNKLWNASRFAMLQLEGKKTLYPDRRPTPLTAADRKIIGGAKRIAKSTGQNIEKYRLGAASRDLYEFFWHDFCDTYIEKAKVQIREAKTPRAADNTRAILLWTLATCLKLLHPFIPFATEEIYSFLPVKGKEALIIENWPEIK